MLVIIVKRPTDVFVCTLPIMCDGQQLPYCPFIFICSFPVTKLRGFEARKLYPSP